jgi:endonuclease VIII
VPEGDTVFRAARSLDKALSGKVLLESDFRVPQHATADLSGQTVNETVPRGKHLLTRTDAGLTLHTHLKMEGAWHLYKPASRWRGGRPHEIRVVLKVEDWTSVGYRLGIVELLPTEREHQAVGHLGPDLLGPEWDLDEALARLKSRPERSIADALLDQTNLAGIGNIYKNETLFVAGVNPWTKVGDVLDLTNVVETAHRLLSAGKEHRTTSTTGTTARGRTAWVFSMGGQPCRRCGKRIRSGLLGPPGEERFTYWCPSCQPTRNNS